MRWLDKLLGRSQEGLHYPTSGLDAQWLAECSKCKDFSLHVSRHGLEKGKGIQHCYTCGHETPISGFDKYDIERMVRSSLMHWQYYPKYPYHWHTLPDQEKKKILRGS